MDSVLTLHAAFSAQSGLEDGLLGVQEVNHSLSVGGMTGGEYNQLKVLFEFLNQFQSVRSDFNPGLNS